MYFNCNHVSFHATTTFRQLTTILTTHERNECPPPILPTKPEEQILSQELRSQHRLWNSLTRPLREWIHDGHSDYTHDAIDYPENAVANFAGAKA